MTDMSGRQLSMVSRASGAVNAGYGHDSIVEAAARQIGKLPYATVILASAPSRGSVLPRALAERAPGDLNHVYFTLGGSDAIDSTCPGSSAITITPKGTPQKDQFISLEQGYHGSSTVARADGSSGFHAGFGIPLDSSTRSLCITLTAIPWGPIRKRLSRSKQALRQKVEEIGAERWRHFMLTIQGSGGVLVPPRAG